jgi:hypothetical protein
MFEVEDDLVKVRPWLKEGIIWLRGDAGRSGTYRCSGLSGHRGGKSVCLPHEADGRGKMPP